jgi:hypothetical protein
MSSLPGHSTYARWEQLSPEKFIGLVMYGALRERVKSAYLLISVYNQFIHSIRATAGMRLSLPPAGYEKGPTGVRYLLANMRACITDAHEIIEGNTETLPSYYSPERYILFLVQSVRSYTRPVERWARALEADASLHHVKMAELGNKHMGDVASDILRHVADIHTLLDFAHSYLEKRRTPEVDTSWLSGLLVARGAAAG